MPFTASECNGPRAHLTQKNMFFFWQLVMFFTIKSETRNKKKFARLRRKKNINQLYPTDQVVLMPKTRGVGTGGPSPTLGKWGVRPAHWATPDTGLPWFYCHSPPANVNGFMGRAHLNAKKVFFFLAAVMFFFTTKLETRNQEKFELLRRQKSYAINYTRLTKRR